MVRLSPVSGSASRWSYRGSDFRIGSIASRGERRLSDHFCRSMGSRRRRVPQAVIVGTKCPRHEICYLCDAFRAETTI
jgi:hypothetical protein